MKILKKPEWLKKEIFKKTEENYIKGIIKKHNLHTVCQEARCPNIGECFSQKKATFLILGNKCTRNCRFCNISNNNSKLCLDENEPERVALAVKEMDLKYVVITSVTRDDLPDQGVSIYIETIKKIKRINKNILIEVLTPDFNGDITLLHLLLKEEIAVFNHNLETIKRLYPEIRPMANYERSLSILMNAKKLNKNILVKTGIMVGLGENKDEVFSLIDDIKDINVDILTIGQYLPPGLNFYPVKRYVTKNEFIEYEKYAKSKGIKMVFSDTFVRSSYFAEKFYINSK